MPEKLVFKEGLKLAGRQRATVARVFRWAASYLDGPLHLHYTDHSIAHSLRVQENVTRLLAGTGCTLSRTEKLILHCAIILHDIGMQPPSHYDGHDPAKPSSYELLKEVRKQHAARSHSLIVDKRQDLGFYPNEEIVDLIALAAKYHDQSYNLDDLDARQVYQEKDVRMRLIAALLRMADALDSDCRRVGSRKPALAAMPVESRYDWFCHHYVRSIDVTDREPKVMFVFNTAHLNDSGIQQALIGRVVQGLSSCIDQVYDTLDAHGIRMRQVATGPVSFEQHTERLDDELAAYIRASASPLTRRPTRPQDGTSRRSGDAILSLAAYHACLPARSA